MNFVNSDQIRQAARDLMAPQLGMLILSLLIFSGIIYVSNMFIVPVSLILVGPLSYGLTAIALRVIASESFDIELLFSGFKIYAQTLVAGLLISLWVFLWSLLLIIPGIVAAFSYSMTFFIMNENPEMTAQEAMSASQNMMMGHKWRLFDLYFSFIGWILLCVITFGLAWLYVGPYMQIATAVFYADLKQQHGVLTG